MHKASRDSFYSLSQLLQFVIYRTGTPSSISLYYVRYIVQQLWQQPAGTMCMHCALYVYKSVGKYYMQCMYKSIGLHQDCVVYTVLYTYKSIDGYRALYRYVR